jgi:hypothetical protein
MNFFTGAIAAMNKHHKDRKCEERRCKCGRKTRRVYQMVDCSDDDHPSSLGKTYYFWAIFDLCDVQPGACKNIKHIDHGKKWFKIHKILWRKAFNSKQFTADEKLLKLAGFIEISLQPLSERIKIAEENARRREASILRNSSTLVVSVQNVPLAPNTEQAPASRRPSLTPPSTLPFPEVFRKMKPK